MSENPWESREDAAFEAALRESLSEPPPEDVIREVTPWRRAMDRVLTGMALNAVTLQFLCLNYILPAIGLVLLLLGFRALRRENGWFRSCFLIVLLKALWLFPQLLLNAGIYRGALSAQHAGQWMTAVGFALTFIQLFCLWQGFRAVRRKAGLPPEAGAAAALLVWYLVIAALALAGFGGIVTGIVMLVAYVLILRGLCRLSSALDEAGYVIAAAPVRVSDGVLVRALAGALALGLVCGYAFGGSYRMDWTPAAAGESAACAEIKTRLRALGFPEEVLADLAEEEILRCAEARQVVVNATDEPFNDGRTVIEREGGTTYHSVAYDVKELRVTGVAVELPGAGETWRVFHHFRWQTDVSFRGTESLQLWPASRLSEAWSAEETLRGRVLYTRDGTDYAAPYAALDSRTFTATGIFWGEQTSTDIFAEFSLPNSGTAQRGYVAYTVSARSAETPRLFDSWMNYTHQMHRWQYPVKTAAEQRMSGAWNDAGAFRTVQHALQFYCTDGVAEQLGAS